MKKPTPQTLLDGTAEDCMAAILASYDRLSMAVTNARELLRLAGVAGARGDTADDLHQALAIHGHLLHQYQVKIRTADHTDVYTLAAASSYSAYSAAAESQGDAPCGITVTPADDMESALNAAHRALKIDGPLDDALKVPALAIVLHGHASRLRGRQTHHSTDYKRLAANDRD